MTTDITDRKFRRPIKFIHGFPITCARCGKPVDYAEVTHTHGRYHFKIVCHGETRRVSVPEYYIDHCTGPLEVFCAEKSSIKLITRGTPA